MMFLGVFTTILLSAAAWGTATEIVLYNFCQQSGCPDGARPNGELVFDAAGNLYGTTTTGGANNGGQGTVFELSPSKGGWTETVLYSFCAQPNCTDGYAPSGPLIFDSLGNLYGTTGGGGTGGGGTVFELSPSQGGWTETVLHSFCAFPCDANPNTGVTMDKAGNLFGTTFYNRVFELSPSGGGGWTESVIYPGSGDFNPAGVTLDAAGDLYGVSANYGSGPDPGGEVFELSTPGVWEPSVLFAFPQNNEGAYPDGYNPYSTPVFDTAGNLYGTTESNGVFSQTDIGGTAFKLTPGSMDWKFKLLHTFNGGKDGAGPLGPLVVDSSGSVYGSTNSGGEICPYLGSAGCGTVFKLTPKGTAYTETVLWRFNFTDGASPRSGVILDKAGNIYGTTFYGGSGTISEGPGVVFEVNPSAATTATMLTSSPNPSTYGEAVTFTAVVASSAGTPPDGETVSFKQGATVLGTATLSGGTATFSISTLGAGTKLVTAVYSGDLNFAGSTSKAVSQVISKATTTTTLVSSQNPSIVGQSVTFTATVTPEFSGKVTGTVTFYDGTTALKTIGVSGGAAKFTTKTLTSGTHTITATYNGSASFDGSSSVPLTQTVN
jgi:uncharacterized repeat protein (TIGR03803 family)